jgi:hypothetical protein
MIKSETDRANSELYAGSLKLNPIQVSIKIHQAAEKTYNMDKFSRYGDIDVVPCYIYGP